MFKKYKNNLDDDIYECQTNGIISESIVQNWTIQALECYKLNCNCKSCPITKAHYSFKCQMKYIVAKLLKKYGKPNEKQILNQQIETNDTIVA